MKRNVNILFISLLLCILVACGGRSSIGLGVNGSGQPGGGPPVTYSEAGLPLPPPDSGPWVVIDTTNDPFAKYDCDNVSMDRVCEYSICSMEGGYNALLEECTIEPYCSQYMDCYLTYILCLEKACPDNVYDPDYGLKCGQDLTDCSTSLTP